MEYQMFSQGLFVVLTPPLCLLVILYFFVRSETTSSESGKGFTKFCLCLSVFNLAVFLYCYLVLAGESGLTRLHFSWEQQLNAINQVTWSSVWSWYGYVFSKLTHTYAWYMFWIVANVFSFVCNFVDLKRREEQTDSEDEYLDSEDEYLD